MGISRDLVAISRDLVGSSRDLGGPERDHDLGGVHGGLDAVRVVEVIIEGVNGVVRMSGVVIGPPLGWLGYHPRRVNAAVTAAPYRPLAPLGLGAAGGGDIRHESALLVRLRVGAGVRARDRARDRARARVKVKVRVTVTVRVRVRVRVRPRGRAPWA